MDTLNPATNAGTTFPDLADATNGQATPEQLRGYLRRAAGTTPRPALAARTTPPPPDGWVALRDVAQQAGVTGLYDDTTSLFDALDEYAEGTGARARYETAEAARRAATEARLDAETVARERAKKARAAVRKALRAAQAEVGVMVPGPDDPAELRPAWARLVRAELAGVDQGLRAAVRRELVRRLTRAGHPDREARAVADRLAPDEPHPAAA